MWALIDYRDRARRPFENNAEDDDLDETAELDELDEFDAVTVV